MIFIKSVCSSGVNLRFSEHNCRLHFWFVAWEVFMFFFFFAGDAPVLRRDVVSGDGGGMRSAGNDRGRYRVPPGIRRVLSHEEYGKSFH